MVHSINLFFLFSVGCALYLITSAASLRRDQNIDTSTDPDMSVATAARLLGKQLSEQQIPRDQVTCAIARYFYRVHPTKNALVLRTPHVKNFKGSEEGKIEVEHESGILNFKVYVFDEGDILLLGEAGFKNYCYMGDFESGGVGRWIFKPRQ